jgi:hypothetical protein
MCFLAAQIPAMCCPIKALAASLESTNPRLSSQPSTNMTGHCMVKISIHKVDAPLNKHVQWLVMKGLELQH